MGATSPRTRLGGPRVPGLTRFHAGWVPRPLCRTQVDPAKACPSGAADRQGQAPSRRMRPGEVSSIHSGLASLDHTLPSPSNSLKCDGPITDHASPPPPHPLVARARGLHSRSRRILRGIAQRTTGANVTTPRRALPRVNVVAQEPVLSWQLPLEIGGPFPSERMRLNLDQAGPCCSDRDIFVEGAVPIGSYYRAFWSYRFTPLPPSTTSPLLPRAGAHRAAVAAAPHAGTLASGVPVRLPTCRGHRGRPQRRHPSQYGASAGRPTCRGSRRGVQPVEEVMAARRVVAGASAGRPIFRGCRLHPERSHPFQYGAPAGRPICRGRRRGVAGTSAGRRRGVAGAKIGSRQGDGGALAGRRRGGQPVPAVVATAPHAGTLPSLGL